VINPDQIKDTKALDFSNRKLIHSSEKYKFNIKVNLSHFEFNIKIGIHFKFNIKIKSYLDTKTILYLFEKDAM